jgi:hypothetical protein
MSKLIEWGLTANLATGIALAGALMVCLAAIGAVRRISELTSYGRLQAGALGLLLLALAPFFAMPQPIAVGGPALVLIVVVVLSLGKSDYFVLDGRSRALGLAGSALLLAYTTFVPHLVSAPEITSVTCTKATNSSGEVVVTQLVHFRDREGNVERSRFSAPTQLPYAKDVSNSTAGFQYLGTLHRGAVIGNWTCGKDSPVHFDVEIEDQTGLRDQRSYWFACDMLAADGSHMIDGRDFLACAPPPEVAP